MGADLATGANTVVEVSHSRPNIPRPNWALSHIKADPVTEQAATAAAKLLKGAGLHGHTYAIDATVAEVAPRQPKPVAPHPGTRLLSGKRRGARQQADGLPRKTGANVSSGQIVGVSSTTSLCGSIMNFQPSLGFRNRTRVG